jgi:hypothetical protein
VTLQNVRFGLELLLLALELYVKALPLRLLKGLYGVGESPSLSPPFGRLRKHYQPNAVRHTYSKLLLYHP